MTDVVKINRFFQRVIPLQAAFVLLVPLMLMTLDIIWQPYQQTLTRWFATLISTYKCSIEQQVGY